MTVGVPTIGVGCNDVRTDEAGEDYLTRRLPYERAMELFAGAEELRTWQWRRGLGADGKPESV